ncbi:hypothetical protein Naga_101299g2 [Nannochloropsis gaditana]|uniref:Uncharacterized protein n=1 Tax=Nannochloropsis gaditana TaxID=72520 RepID=W7T7B0_9STRA|nr:hypothetical protein Naga_101299g2 [Nannochloropsis gaditana]
MPWENVSLGVESPLQHSAQSEQCTCMLWNAQLRAVRAWTFPPLPEDGIRPLFGKYYPSHTIQTSETKRSYQSFNISAPHNLIKRMASRALLVCHSFCLLCPSLSFL